MSYTIYNFNGPNHQITLKHKAGLLTAFYYEKVNDSLVFKDCFSDICSNEMNYADSLRRVLEKVEEATGLQLMRVKAEETNEPNRNIKRGINSDK